MRIHKANPSQARHQAAWIAAMEPWVSMGYRAAPFGRWLARCARAGGVWVAEGRQVLGVIVVQPDFLLGNFISLLAVHPQFAGQGVGRALVTRVERATYAKRRWLYVSSDSANQGAARFYKTLGFSRVARLPALISEDRTEILWRKLRP